MRSIKNIVAIIVSLVIYVGLALAGGDGGAEYHGMSIFMIAGCLILLVHLVVFIPSFIMRTEHYFDLTGSLSYITGIGCAWWLSPNTWNPMNIILGMMILVWAVRLGSFLFLRVKKVGKDIRFDDLKSHILSFSMVWVLSALWVYITVSAALAAMTSSTALGLDVWFVAGIVLWIIGLAVESVADAQKYAFKFSPDSTGRFISHGLWAWSRHPNYFGEIVLWFGIAIMSFPVLAGYQYITLISPLFVWFLLTKISGIPMLEVKADKRWGEDEEYLRYKASTPILVPKSPQNK